MNIQEFISETLRQISAGVSGASGENGIELNPRPLLDEHSNSQVGHMINSRGRHPIVLIEFDLAVTVHSKIEGFAAAGLTVLGIGGKGEINSGIDQTRVQRVKFHVPISFKLEIPA